MQDKRNFQGGLNRDDDSRVMPNGDYFYAQNVRVLSSEDRSTMLLESVRGMIKESMPAALSDITNKGLDWRVIGSYEDRPTNCIYYFLWSAFNYHSILEYNINTDTVSIVFRDNGDVSNLLRFDKETLITGINKIDDLLYWTSDNEFEVRGIGEMVHNEPKYINVEKAKAGWTIFYDGGDYSINPQTAFNLDTMYPYEFYAIAGGGINLPTWRKRKYIDVCKTRPYPPIYFYKTPIKNITTTNQDINTLIDAETDLAFGSVTVTPGEVIYVNATITSIEESTVFDFAYKKNNLYGFMWQFAYRYVYKDNEVSSYSEWSHVMPSPQYATNKVDETKQNSYNQIRVWYWNGPADVDKIEIVARKCSYIETSPDEGNKGEYYLISTIDNNYYDANYTGASSDVESIPYQYGYNAVTTKNIPYIRTMADDGTTLQYSGEPYGYIDFRNDGVYTQVDPVAFNKLYDRVPKRAKSQELINENRIVYGNYIDGFNQVLPHFHLSPTYGEGGVQQEAPTNPLTTVDLDAWNGDPSDPQNYGLSPITPEAQGANFIDRGTKPNDLSGDATTGMLTSDYTPYSYPDIDEQLNNTQARKAFGWDSNMQRSAFTITFPTNVTSGQTFRIRMNHTVRYYANNVFKSNDENVEYPFGSGTEDSTKAYDNFGFQIDLTRQVSGGGVSGMIDDFISDIKTMANFQQSSAGAGLTDLRGNNIEGSDDFNPNFNTGKIYTTYMVDSDSNQTYAWNGGQTQGAALMRLSSIKKLDSDFGTNNVLQIEFVPYGQSIGTTGQLPENGCNEKVNKEDYYYPDGTETTNLHVWKVINESAGDDNSYRDSTKCTSCSGFQSIDNSEPGCDDGSTGLGSSRWREELKREMRSNWSGESAAGINIEGPAWSDTTGLNDANADSVKNAETAACFKSGAWHRFGLVYYDGKGRSSTVMLNTEDISDTTYDRNSSVYVGFPPERIYEQGLSDDFDTANPSGLTTTSLTNAQKLSPVNIYWKIFHKPPIWARYYHWVYARNTSVGDFMQFTIDNAYVNKGAKAGTTSAEAQNDTKIYISLNTMDGRLWSYSQKNRSLVGDWSFAEGDRVRLIAQADGTVFDKYYDFKVGDVGNYPGRFDIDPSGGEGISDDGVSGNVALINESPVGGSSNEPQTAKLGKFIVIDDPKIDGYGVELASDANGDIPNWHKVTVEIYRPKKNTTEEQSLYYEFSERFGIGDIGKETRYHMGRNEGNNQQPSDYNSDNKTLNAPARGVFMRGDVWYKPRNLKVIDSGGGSVNLGEIWYESYFLNDFLQTNHNNIGRPHLYSIYSKEQRRKATLTYSDVYQPDTQYNGLHSFSFSQRPYMDYDLSLGSIQKLVSRDTNLVMLQENKTSRILVNKDIITTPSGDQGITLSTNVLPETAEPFSGDYGVSTNPESVAIHESKIYFTDIKKGAVCRLGGDGITVISDYKMKDFFRDKMDEYQSILTSEYEEKLGGGLFIIGGYDPRHGEYVLTFPPIYNTTTSSTLQTSIAFYNTNAINFNSASSNFETFITDPYIVTNENMDDSILQEINGREISVAPVTLSFNESANRWSSFYTFYPEYYGSLNRVFISFKNGVLYKHDYDSTNHSMFYENPLPSETKVSFPFNIDVSSVKSWNSLSIEGSAKQQAIPLITTSAIYAPVTVTATTDSANLEGANVSFTTNDIVVGDSVWYNDNGTLRTLGVITAITDADTIVTSITEVNAFITASSTSSGAALNNVFIISGGETAFKTTMTTNINSTSLVHRLSYDNDVSGNNFPGNWVEREDVLSSNIPLGETNSAGGEYFGLGMSSFDSGSTFLLGRSLFGNPTTLTNTNYTSSGVVAGDSVYWDNSGVETLIGTVSSVNSESKITLSGNATSSQDNKFCYVKKNSTIEGDRLKGHYMDTTLTKRTKDKVHIYAANANIINSELSNK